MDSAIGSESLWCPIVNAKCQDIGAVAISAKESHGRTVFEVQIGFVGDGDRGPVCPRVGQVRVRQDFDGARVCPGDLQRVFNNDYHVRFGEEVGSVFCVYWVSAIARCKYFEADDE